MYWEAIAKGFYPMRIDADSDREGTGSHDSTGGSETTFAPKAAMTNQAADGGVIVVTSGNNK
ncbi:unnamed protein product, partial [marine sediment metagenome]